MAVTKLVFSAPAKKKAKTKDAPIKRRTDWDAVERDYRTGKFTLRELEAKHGAFNSSISRKAKKDGWTQDLSIAIKQATNAKLAEALVSSQVSEGLQKVSNTVLAAAEVNKQIIVGHRSDIVQANQVVRDLLVELKESALLAEHKKQLALILAGDNPSNVALALEAIKRALALSSRVGSVKALAEAITKLQTAERKAFGLDDGADDEPDPLRALINRFNRSTVPVIHAT